MKNRLGQFPSLVMVPLNVFHSECDKIGIREQEEPLTNLLSIRRSLRAGRGDLPVLTATAISHFLRTVTS